MTRALAARGGRLVLRRGGPETALPALIREIGVTAVFWNRCYQPWHRARDARLKAALCGQGIEVWNFKGDALWEPWEIATRAGRPFRIFTPFARACRSADEPEAPLPVPAQVPAPEHGPEGERLEDWGLTPQRPDWAGGLRETWTPGEADAQAHAEAFLVQRGRGLRRRSRPPGSERRLHPITLAAFWGDLAPPALGRGARRTRG